MFKNIPKSDISSRAFNVYKEWNFDETTIDIMFGKRVVGTTFDAETDEKSGKFYKRLIYDSIKTQYYISPETASVLYGRRINFTSDYERSLGDEMGVISIPNKYVGYGIKPGSVTISDPDTDLVLSDDSNSNLVSGSIVYGNVFYENGLIILTKDVVSGSNWNRYELQYKSTKTIYENEIFISVNEGEFNYSTNPTAIVDIGGQTKTIKITDPNDYTMNRQIDFTYYNAGSRYVKTEIIADDGVTVYDYRIPSVTNPNFLGGFDDYEKF
jgi:hypothetical protein